MDWLQIGFELRSGNQHPHVACLVLPALVFASGEKGFARSAAFLFQLDIASKDMLVEKLTDAGPILKRLPFACIAWSTRSCGSTISSCKIRATSAGFLRTPPKAVLRTEPCQDSWGAEPASVPGIILSGAERQGASHSSMSPFHSKYWRWSFVIALASQKFASFPRQHETRRQAIAWKCDWQQSGNSQETVGTVFVFHRYPQ